MTFPAKRRHHTEINLDLMSSLNNKLRLIMHAGVNSKETPGSVQYIVERMIKYATTT